MVKVKVSEVKVQTENLHNPQKRKRHHNTKGLWQIKRYKMEKQATDICRRLNI